MSWEEPGGRPPTLAPGAVHVWRARTDVPAGWIPALAGVLGGDEVARAERLRAARDRDRFIARRAFLRAVLARYVGEDPARLRFRRAAGSRPVLAAAAAGIPPAFSAASSGDLALYAIAAGGALLGIDVERVAPALDWMQIARRFFTRGEVAALERLPPAARRAAFLAFWTCKEACAKAMGDGLAAPLDRLEVRGAERAGAARIRGEVHDSTRDPARVWSVRRFAPAPGYAAALATARAPARFRFYDAAL